MITVFYFYLNDWLLTCVLLLLLSFIVLLYCTVFYFIYRFCRTCIVACSNKLTDLLMWLLLASELYLYWSRHTALWVDTGWFLTVSRRYDQASRRRTGVASRWAAAGSSRRQRRHSGSGCHSSRDIPAPSLLRRTESRPLSSDPRVSPTPDCSSQTLNTHYKFHFNLQFYINCTENSNTYRRVP